MSYKVNLAALSNAFFMPAEVSDKLLKFASGTQLKVIIYAFRHASEGFIDAAKTASVTGEKPQDVEQALRFWASTGILQADTSLPEVSAGYKPENEKKELPDIPTVRPSYEQIQKRCEEEPDLKLLLNEAQRIFGRTIGYDAQATIIMIHDSYGLPVEVITMLLQYCKSEGKISYAYIAKIAKDWGERGIDTLEKADEVITRMNASSKIWAEFTALSGIQNPKPTAAQARFMLKWVNDLKYGADMIYAAYEEMANHCARTSFNYMDTVLVNWAGAGLRTPAEVESLRQQTPRAGKAKPAEKKGKKQTSYDMSLFEQKAEDIPVYNKKKKDADK